MIWKKYTVRTTTADCELVCATLMDYGITDVQIENNVQLTDEELNQMYADFVKELPEDDGSCSVSFYLDENDCVPESFGTGDSPSSANETAGFEGVHVDLEEVRNGLWEASELFGIQPVSWEETTVDTQDWNNKWKEYFKPFCVDRVIIKPTWEEVPEDMQGDVVISIDPGMAFGTGIHETTRLCLKGLQQQIAPGAKVLDLGCGSGILGIAAAKLGASLVTAVDIDMQAVQIAFENFEQNEIDSDYDLMTANILQDTFLQEQLEKEPYDIVLANILADVIVPLSGFVHRFLKKDGVMIASGIIAEKEQDVCDAVRNNDQLELEDVSRDGDWRAVTVRRK